LIYILNIENSTILKPLLIVLIGHNCLLFLMKKCS